MDGRTVIQMVRTQWKLLKMIFLFCIMGILLFPAMTSLGKEKEEGKDKADSEETEQISAAELDLGDYKSEMLVGEKQLLMVTILPENATGQNLGFASSDTAVATVNGLGRITALKEGETKITVTCGKISADFLLTVNIEETKTAQDIEIGDYDEELKVDAVLDLTASVIPSDAIDTTVNYQSSDTNVATVSSSGEVKGIAPGQVIIYISAGNVMKQIPLTVKIETALIKLNSSYQVMKLGDTFQIEAAVQPSGAECSLTYKSLDTKVATVSPSGMITAKACGNTAAVISNGDLQVSVTIIVNQEGKADCDTDFDTDVKTQDSVTFPEKVTVKEYPIISGDMLKYFYDNKKSLTIEGDNYTIYLDGKDIVNYKNELNTKLEMKEERNGFSFIINEGKKLCGKLTIDFSKKVHNEKYLYLYNVAKEKYEILLVNKIEKFAVDTEGTYILAENKLSSIKLDFALMVLGVSAVFVGIAIYIMLKKQHWFW